MTPPNKKQYHLAARLSVDYQFNTLRSVDIKYTNIPILLLLLTYSFQKKTQRKEMFSQKIIIGF